MTAQHDEGYRQVLNMVVVGFGRETDVRKLTGTENVCTFGFVDKSLGHAGLEAHIEGTLAKPWEALTSAGGGGGAAGASSGGTSGGGGGGAIANAGAAGTGAGVGAGALGGSVGNGGVSGGATSGLGGAPATGGAPPASAAVEADSGCNLGRPSSTTEGFAGFGAITLALAMLRRARARALRQRGVA